MSRTSTSPRSSRRRGSSRRRSSRARRSLSAAEKRILLVLGLPTLAMAFSTTSVSTYLPVVARRFTGSAAVIGVIIAGEGLMALFVPLLSGSWSDRFRARGGSRLAFVLAGIPVVLAGLLPMGFVASLPAMGLLVAVFFAGIFFSYEPYRALYPDTLPDEVAGRGQATQAVWRGSGTVLALAGGGLLLNIWRPLPFAVSALLQASAVIALLLLLPKVSEQSRKRSRIPGLQDFQAGARDVARQVRKLLSRHPELRLFLVANCLWELSLGALKTFIVLYVTEGLHHSLRQASLIIGGVAVIVVLGAVASGKLGDRYGNARTMQAGLWVYGVALLVPAFTRSPAVLGPFVPLIAFGGGLVMTLPYAILIPLMPKDSHGILTGFYSLSRGLGVMLGPLLAGIAIQLLKGPFSSTHGFAAMWLVTSGAVLASIPALGSLRKQSK